MSTTVTFGEVMVRLEPSNHQRLLQEIPGNLNAWFAGAEANVAVGIAQLGGNARFVSAVPDNLIADALERDLRAHGVDTGSLIRVAGSRLGVFYSERGTNQRSSLVVYDRAGSAIATTGADAYDWSVALEEATWFHTTGITPAISESAAEATLHAVGSAKNRGLTVSCDLNFRSKLWNWDGKNNPTALARRTMPSIISCASVLIGNEQDAADVLGISPATSDVERGNVSHDDYVSIARQIAQRFPDLRLIAFTLRESISASHNRWGAMLYSVEDDRASFAPLVDGEYRPYEITNIVDRVGGGDSFAAGLIWAQQTEKYASPSESVAFATGFSCLAHSINGDFAYIEHSEVEKLLHIGGSGRVIR